MTCGGPQQLPYGPSEVTHLDFSSCRTQTYCRYASHIHFVFHAFFYFVLIALFFKSFPNQKFNQKALFSKNEIMFQLATIELSYRRRTYLLVFLKEI